MLLLSSPHVVELQASQLAGIIAPELAWKLKSDGADCHLFSYNRHDEITGWCSLWWQNTARLRGLTTGYIGHYNAQDQTTASSLLQAAARRLAQARCQIAIGPINGSTWRAHRFITGTSAEPQFFLETFNPPEFPEHFRQSGFSVCATYTSALNREPFRRDELALEFRQHMSTMGLTTRSFEPSKAQKELSTIHALSLEAFAKNLLFSPIGKDEFLAHYAALTPYVVPELIIMLTRDEELLGFCFAVPNYCPGKKTQTAIIKTLARKPDANLAGAGRFLLDAAQERAHELGFKSIIHAFMKSDNKSRQLSDRCADTIREYSLFAKTIAE